MGVYWYLSCLHCKEMLPLGKLSEPDRLQEIYAFMRVHSEAYPVVESKHKLIVASDVGDSEVITDTPQGWITDFTYFDYEDYLKKKEKGYH